MGQYILLHPKGNSKMQAPLGGIHFSRLFYCTSWDPLFPLLECFKQEQTVYLLFSHIANFNRNSTLVLRLRLYCPENTLVTKNSYRSSRTNLFLPKSPYAFGVNMAIFGCGLSYPLTPANPTFGLWNKPSFSFGSLASILHLFINSSTAAKASSHVLPSPTHASLAPSRYGANYDGTLLLNEFDKLYAIPCSTNE